MESDWLQQIAQAFARHPDAALVFGTAVAPPHDPDEYFVPIFPVTREHAIRGYRAFVRPDGMGATMCIRRKALTHVGLLDTYLGVGSPLSFGGEDNDYIYRCLMAGYSVVRTPQIQLVHHGARSRRNGDAKRLFRGYAYSAGITDMKLLRSGHPIAVLLMTSHLAYFALEMLRRGPRDAGRLAMYLRGLVGSFQLQVDRQTGLFTPRAAQPNMNIKLPVR